jgi:hypothetical protein
LETEFAECGFYAVHGIIGLEMPDYDEDGNLDLLIGTFEVEVLFRGATKPWRPFLKNIAKWYFEIVRFLEL